MQQHIKRNYHSGSPAKNNALLRKVMHATRTGNYANEPWVQEFLATGTRCDQAYNLARNGDRVLIANRDILWQEVVVLMDELAARLEAEAVRNPAVLASSGFDLTTDSRRSARGKQPQPLATSGTSGGPQMDLQDQGKDSSVETQPPAG